MPRQAVWNDLRRFSQNLVYITLLSMITTIGLAQSWITVSPGIRYMDLNQGAITPWSHIHVFRIDLSKNDMSLAHANTGSGSSAEAFAKKHGAVLAINGGFFDAQYHPLGLRISGHVLSNPLKSISWWGVFYIKNHQAHMVGPKQYSSRLTPDFAIQSGPRLLVNKHIPKLKTGYAERSALGIDAHGQVIILVTEHMPMTATDLAQLMRRPPLSCDYALNLDGGSSTQLYTRMKQLNIHHPGFALVSDGVLVTPRQ